MSIEESRIDEVQATQPLDQVRTVWLALAGVLLTLTVFVVAFGWRTFDVTAKRALNQSQSRAELTQVQLSHAFGHIDDVLLQTKSVFERQAPGPSNPVGLIAKRSQSAGPAPYTCIGLVNAQGDAFLKVPEFCSLPDLAGRGGELFQQRTRSGLVTDVFESVEGLRLVRAIRLNYEDDSFAGMAVAVVNPDYLFAALKELLPDEYQVRLDLAQSSGAFRNLGFAGTALDDPTMAVATTVLELEGLSAKIRLNIRSSISRSAAWGDWFESVLWPLLGYLLVVAGLLQGARLLTRALRQQINSDLLVQRARVEGEVQNRFIANISHEVRTPMNGVLGAARLLGRTSLNENQRQILGLVERSGTSLLGIINDLLDIGKLREGQMALERQSIDLVDLLEDSCALHAPQAFAKGLKFVVLLDIPPNLGALGDALRIQQIVTNLLSNAVKFTPTGVVSLNAGIQEASGRLHFQLKVADTGIGMDLTESTWLFQPFQQADSSTARRFGGTGLGLAIADQLVRLMGGVLEVQSQLGVGTTFSATWPLLIENDAASTPESRPVHGLTCEIALSKDALGSREYAALACHLKHLGIRLVPQQSASANKQEPSRHAVLTDEDCLAHERLRWLEPDVTLIILSREPGLFKVPPHLQTAQPVVIGKPARRAELFFGLTRERPPINNIVVNAAEPRNVELHATVPVEGALSGLHFLVAEDHAVNQILIRHMLHAAGAKVHLVANGLEAVDALFRPDAEQDGRFDLVLMDCQMPELDGFEATRRIRQAENLHKGTGRIPVIAMTALAMPEDMQRCLDSGMDDYCPKPIDERMLMAKIIHWSSLRTSMDQGNNNVSKDLAEAEQVDQPH